MDEGVALVARDTCSDDRGRGASPLRRAWAVTSTIFAQHGGYRTQPGKQPP